VDDFCELTSFYYQDLCTTLISLRAADKPWHVGSRYVFVGSAEVSYLQIMELAQNKPDPTQFKRPEVGAIATQSLYCTEYFNDPRNIGFFARIFEELKIWMNPNESRQQSVLDEVVHLRLCEIHGVEGAHISIPISVNNKERILHLQETNGIALIYFTDANNSNNNGSKAQIEGLRSLGIGFADLREKLAAQIAHTLNDSVNELSKPLHCLAWVEIQSSNGNDTNITHHENLNPDYANFVEINVGNSEDKTLTTTDTGTVIKRDSRLAATLVDGGVNKLINRSIPLVKLPIYSAIITTAAMHTVERGVLMLGLNDNELQMFFFETVKLLLQAQSIELALQDWPAFNGVVFYQEAGLCGVHKKLEYGTDEVGEHTVKVNVSETVPVEGFNMENKRVQLTAANKANDHNALHISIDIVAFIVGRDDFTIIPLSPSSSRYKYVKPSSTSTSAQLEPHVDEIKKQKKPSTLDEQKREIQCSKERRAEKRRILTNSTADICIGDITALAEKYESSEEKFEQQISAIKKLQRPKIRLLETQHNLAQLEKSGCSELEFKQKQHEVQMLKDAIFAEQKKVLGMLHQRDIVQEKLKKNLDQLKKELEQKQNDPLIQEEPEKTQQQLQTLEKEVLKQQKKVAKILKKKEAIDQELDKQKKVDEVLAHRHSEEIKQKFEAKIEEARIKEQQEKIKELEQHKKRDDEI